jgi:hypothetical protein
MTTDMTRADRRPYFLWDEDVTIQEPRAVIDAPDSDERTRLFAKMLREARDIDVWCFVSPTEVARVLPALGRRLGRRRAFWEFLIRGWKKDGILAA